MNKKFNSILFLLAATILNIIILLTIFISTYTLQFTFGSYFPASVNTVAAFLLFAVSCVLTYFIYKRLITFLSQKIDMKKYFTDFILPLKRREKGIKANNGNTETTDD